MFAHDNDGIATAGGEKMMSNRAESIRKSDTRARLRVRRGRVGSCRAKSDVLGVS